MTTINLGYRQCLEVMGALEDRINRINSELFQLFEGDEKMTEAYHLEIEYLRDTINQIKGVAK